MRRRRFPSPPPDDAGYIACEPFEIGPADDLVKHAPAPPVEFIPTGNTPTATELAPEDRSAGPDGSPVGQSEANPPGSAPGS